MLKWLKRHLIPHHINGHRPHLLHGENARMVVIMVLMFELFVFLLPMMNVNESRNQKMAAVLPAMLATLTNEERSQQALPELTVNPVLTRAAEMKAQDMAEKGYFAHTSPEGKTPWHWLKTAGYDYTYAGENLAINFTESKDVTTAWMNSPGHRANIVKGSYTEVGTGVATGMYEGRETLFVAQVYASPRTAVAASPVPVSVPTPEESSIARGEPVIVAMLEEPQEVLGAAVEEVPVVMEEVATAEKVTAAPAHRANTVLMIIGGAVLLAVVLTMLIKINTQHPDLITNGLAVMAVIGGIMVGNTFMSTQSLKTLQTEYSFAPETFVNQW